MEKEQRAGGAKVGERENERKRRVREWRRGNKGERERRRGQGRRE